MSLLFPTYENIESYVIKNIELSYNFDVDFKSLFEKDIKENDLSFEQIYKTEPIFFEWQGFRFPVFIHNNQKELFKDDGNISFDIFLNTFIFISGYLEILSKERDKHGRFPFEASLQKKYDFVKIPVVNIYFKLLQYVASKKGKQFEEKKYKNPIIFTHDIDQLRSGWFENIQYHFRNLSLNSLIEIPKNILVKLLKQEDDYFLAMKKMIAIDKQHNVNSISFFIPKKSKMDADFDVSEKKYIGVLKEIEKHQTIGLHPGYDTFKDSKEFIKQKKSLEKITQKGITQSRQHFLRYDMNSTPYIIEESGISEDYTLGFAEQYGFRNGIANPFYLFNFKEQKAFNFKSIPLAFMDVSLTNYSLEKDFDAVYNFFQYINSNFNCKYSVLFHNSVFSGAKYNGFEDFYLKLISISK